ncbi:ABC transporter ATP-binding protein [Lujinxingia sediminis]|uniref:ABC transporter ATP-binding protein n=1 Tax=Lujinxingia sediminis TaxID=2480984 RepID=A0ABY0CNG4_9DELT|nr:ABC transporter ATP-binding protein [Lujinxingia sediminis]RVU40702.1 ABC transporter ATP-binding protein [Lujinxingia sediminis]
MSPSSDSSTSSGPRLATVSTRERRKILWGYFKRYRGLFAAGAVFLLLTNGLALAIPQQLGDAVQLMRDSVGAGAEQLAETRQQVIRAAMIIIALAIGAGIARVYSRTTIFNAGRHIEFDLRNELYTHLARLTPRFYGSMPTGDITSRVTNDVTYVRLLFAIAFLHIVNAIVAYTIGIQRMVALDLGLTLWCLAPLPLLLLGMRSIIRALFEQTKRVQAELSNISSRVQENLSGVDVIKAYTLQGREIADYTGLNTTFYEENVKLARIRAMLNAMIVLIANVGTLVVLIVGAQRVIAGTMELGTFVEFNGYVVALAFPTIALGWVFAVWHRGLAAFERICEVRNYEPVVADPGSQACKLPTAEERTALGHIELDHVTFAYDESPVLNDISLSIPAGSTVAIVGKTGSGKSTLVKLLARLYDPTAGQIRVDGVTLTQAPLRELRSEIGFVPQEPFLFSMTIGQNIRFGLDALQFDETLTRRAPTAPLIERLGSGTDGSVTQQDRINQAVQIAALDSDLEAFDKGLDTLVGERGVTLSGGQKQRTTIARALLTDPRILILDDALASVDTQTERRILNHLKELMQGRTSILITHRFNALTQVDRIFVLDHGELIEQGTHAQLLEQGGLYAEMYARQKLREQLES